MRTCVAVLVHRVKNVNPEQCFWLSVEYYQKVVKFYMNRDGRRR